MLRLNDRPLQHPWNRAAVAADVREVHGAAAIDNERSRRKFIPWKTTTRTAAMRALSCQRSATSGGSRTPRGISPRTDSLSSLIDCSSARVHAYRAHIKSLLTVINRLAAGIYLTLRTPRVVTRARMCVPGIRARARRDIISGMRAHSAKFVRPR